MFQPERLHLINFLCWRKFDFHFRAELALVVGENGQGKSSVWDGLLWALYGKTLRGVSGDEVIQEGQKIATVELDWASPDGRRWKVVRNRTKGETMLALFAQERLGSKDVSGATPTFTQEKIDALIGHDAASFTAAVFFGQDVARWAAATDKEQKVLLERLLGMGLWERVQKEVKRRQSADSLALQFREANYAKAKEGLAELAIRREALLKQATEERQTRFAKLKALDSDLASLERLKRVLVSKAPGIEKECKEAEAVLDRIAEKASDPAVLERRAELVANIANRESRLVNLDAEIKLLARKLPKVGGSCRLCGQKLYARAHAHVYAREKSRMRDLVGERNPILGNLKDDRAALAKLPKVEENLAGLKQAEKRADAAHEAARDLEQRLQSLKDKRLGLEADRKVLLAKADTFEVALKELATTKATYQKTLDEADGELKEAADTKAALGWLDKACSPAGIRSYLLDTTLPRFTKTINRFLKTMAPDLRVELSGQSELKSGESRERLSFRVCRGENVRPYLALSQGQRQRIDFCVAVALQQLARQRTQIALAVFDEAFERLDADGCDRAVRLLHQLAKETPTVFVITHNENLKSLFGRAYRVQMKDGESQWAS